MKCKYKYCKNGNEVDKNEAIKIGSTYYCKECYQEKEDKANIVDIVYSVLPSETKTNVNKCICDWIHKKGFSTEYVMYTLDYIKKNRCSIKSAYGIIYYLNNQKIYEEYAASKNMKLYNNISKSNFECDENEVKFTYKSDTGKGWCKIL